MTRDQELAVLVMSHARVTVDQPLKIVGGREHVKSIRAKTRGGRAAARTRKARGFEESGFSAKEAK